MSEWDKLLNDAEKKPEFPKLGEVYEIIFGKVELKTETRKGQYGEYTVFRYILQAKGREGVLRPLSVKEYQFKEIGQKFKEAGNPKSIIWVCIR